MILKNVTKYSNTAVYPTLYPSCQLSITTGEGQARAGTILPDFCQFAVKTRRIPRHAALPSQDRSYIGTEEKYWYFPWHTLTIMETKTATTIRSPGFFIRYKQDMNEARTVSLIRTAMAYPPLCCRPEEIRLLILMRMN